MTIIRKAKKEDIDEITAMSIELLKLHEEMDDIFAIKKDADKTMKAWFTGILNKKDRLLLVAEKNNELIGYLKAGITKRPEIYKIEKAVFIYDIYIKSDFRKKGVAKKFLDETLKWAKNKKVKAVSLNVATANENAIFAWKKYGFKEFMKEKYLEI